MGLVDFMALQDWEQSTRKLFSDHTTIWLIILDFYLSWLIFTCHIIEYRAKLYKSCLSLWQVNPQFSTSRRQVLPDIDLRQTRFHIACSESWNTPVSQWMSDYGSDVVESYFANHYKQLPGDVRYLFYKKIKIEIDIQEVKGKKRSTKHLSTN